MEELEIKKLKTTNTILLSLIVVLIIFVLGLGYYTFFMKESKKENVNNTKTEENTKKEEVEETNNDEQKGESNALTNNQISDVLNGFSYEKILSIKDKNSNSLTDEELLYIAYRGLSESDKLSTSSEKCDFSESSKEVKCMLHNMGLSDDMVDNADTKLWDNILAGSTEFVMVAKNIMSQKIKEIFGREYVFNNSFVKGTPATCGGATFIYDKNIDMITVKFDGGCAGYPNAIKITRGYKDGENYVISIVKGMLELYDSENIFYYKLFSEAHPNVIVKDNISDDLTKENFEDLILQYKDRLDNYDLTFKKVGDNYQFVSVDYKG